jgi:4-amino-4-deoxy-L-arabinose transferase-like glycosyltransferase
MYQPPLYYAMAAAVLRSFGHTALDYDTLALLRWINVAGGLVVLGSLLGSLRLMFPDCPRRWVIGFCLGAFLPAQLYMSQYVGNETWAAAWAAIAFYVCLGIVRRRETSLGRHLLLGALLGAGMLTKFSALIVLGPIVMVLVASLVARGERAPGAWARSVGAVLLVAGLTCGWHFVRVALRFGKPLVGNWDPATGFSWWQDPGYQTGPYYLRFGLSLVEPIFSSFHSFADGIFSTAWGDGLLGGSSDRAVRPPWNYDLMTSGYLLACLPTLAILAGLAAAVVDLVRRPRAEWFLALGILGAAGFAIFLMTLRLPFHSQAKAFYGLSALVPVSLVGAWGFDVLGGGRHRVGLLLSLAWGTWALNAWASFWIRG